MAATWLDDVQLFAALATPATTGRGALGKGRCAGQRGRRDVPVVMRLELVGVASGRSLTEGLHGVLMGQAEDGFAVGIGAAGESRSSHHLYNAAEGSNVPSSESQLGDSAVDLVLPRPCKPVEAGPGDPARAIPKMVLGRASRTVGPAAFLVDVVRRRLIGRRGVAMRFADTDPLDQPTVHPQTVLRPATARRRAVRPPRPRRR
jgi:hypothetical protein